MGFWRGYLFLMSIFAVGLYGLLAVHYWLGDLPTLIFAGVYTLALMSPYLIRPRELRD